MTQIAQLSHHLQRLCLIALAAIILGSGFCRAKEKDANALVEEGNAAAEKGDYDVAITAYTHAHAIDPKHAGTLQNRGNAYREKGEYAKALDDYVQLLKVAPAASLAQGTIADRRRRPEQPFLLAIEDVFYINGVGTVATGQIVRGEAKPGQAIEAVGSTDTRKATIVRLETAGKTLEAAKAGDNCGVVLRGVGRDEVKRGEVLAAPGSIIARKNFEAEIYLLTKEEGGRSTPVSKNYRPQFHFRTIAVSGTVIDVGEAESALPGQRQKFTIELSESIALDEGLLFAVREGGRTVGMGIVAELR